MLGPFWSIVSLVSFWNSLCWSWWCRWDGEHAFLASIWYAVFGFGVPSFLFGAWESSSHPDGYWGCLKMSLGLGAFGALFGAFVAVSIAAPLPLVVWGSSYAMVLFGGFALMFYRERLFSRAKTMMVRHVPGALRKMGAWARRTIFRRRPLDYLAELDISAQEVSRRLEQLCDRKLTLEKREEYLTSEIAEAERILKAFADGSAAAAIARDTVRELRKDLHTTANRLGRLRDIVGQIQDGKQEMGNLIHLAQLRRRMRDDDVHGEDTRAIEEARRTLEALREAFARADAALCAVMAEADVDLGLAFQYEAEAVTRSANLQKAAERLEAPAPSGVRV